MVDITELIGELPEKEVKGKMSSGRVNVTLFRQGAWFVDKEGAKQPYPDAGNYDRMIENAGIPDDPALLMTVCDRLLQAVASGSVGAVE